MEQILKSWRTTIVGLIVTFVGFMHFKGWISQDVFDFAFATLAGGGLIAAADGKQTEAAQAEAPDMLIILNEILALRNAIADLKPKPQAAQPAAQPPAPAAKTKPKPARKPLTQPK
jgi:hypothetical protein